MAKLSRPRKGSLQFYPRKRAAKFIPRVNWSTIKSAPEGLLGFITYKVGMGSAVVKDMTDKSMSSNKKVVIPVTILEVPPMKVFSIRYYKFNKPVKEIVVSHDKELKRALRVPKTLKDHVSHSHADYDDVRVIVYSVPSQTSVKKTPDLIEIAISAPSKEKKLEIAKSLVGKEISLSDFSKTSLVDVRGLTTGRGTQGPVKRFGLTLRFHKSEKGVRGPGSLGPWHPARVTFRTPIAGQMGLFSRVHYNLKIVSSGKISEKDINPKNGFKDYGKVKTSYILLNGSVQGPRKRQILITPSFRPTKMQAKKKLEFEELKL